MADDAEFDEYLMTVVETALGKSQSERSEYLRLVCAGNERLYKEARERVMWEERMGGFLSDPLINTDPDKEKPAAVVVVPQATAVSRRRWLAAPIALAALLIGWKLFLLAGPAPVRLAILPFTGAGIPQDLAKALSIDVERRLTGSRRNFEILAPIDPNQQFQTAEEAAQSGATHVLQAGMEPGRSRISLREVTSGKEFFQLEKNYAQLFDLADEIMAGLSKTLSLKVHRGVSKNAYTVYLTGLAFLRKDNQQSLKSFLRAAELDRGALSPLFGAAEAEWMRYLQGDGRDAGDRAAAYLNQCKAIQPDSVAVLILTGLYQMEYGNYEAAAKELEEAVRIDPANRDAWQTLVMAQISMGKPEAAMAFSRTALEANPESYWPYLLLASLLERQQPAEAAKIREALLKKFPRAPSEAALKNRYKDQ